MEHELGWVLVSAREQELTRDRSALSLLEGNREIDKLLRGGVEKTIPDRGRGRQRVDVLRVVDWNDVACGRWNQARFFEFNE